MNDDATRAHEEAQSMASKVPGLLEGLAERLGTHAGAQAVFGQPVEKDGRTVIPVAQAIIGTGAGAGGETEAGSGIGAGGGAMTRPLGYIEVTADAAAFVPLTRPWGDARLILAWTLLALVLSRALVKLLRG